MVTSSLLIYIYILKFKRIVSIRERKHPMDDFLDAVDDGLDWAYKAVVPPTPKERLRRAHSEIRRSLQRLKSETDRSIRDENTLRHKMRSEAVRGEISATKATASTIVRGQISRTNLNKLQNRLTSLKSRLDAANTAESMNSIMKDTTAAMGAVGRSLGGKDLQKTVTSFERQNILLGNLAETMSEAVDDCEEEQELDGDSIEMQTANMVDQMMEEISVESLMPLPNAPTTTTIGFQVRSRPPPPDAAPRVPK